MSASSIEMIALMGFLGSTPSGQTQSAAAAAVKYMPNVWRQSCA